MNSNSISHNLSKLQKYQSRVDNVNDISKRSVYNQKINFYKGKLKGGGIESDALYDNGYINNYKSSDVDSLISKIDSMIHKSKHSGSRSTQNSASYSNSINSMTGGSLDKVSGHRIMTVGLRGGYKGSKRSRNQRKQYGGADSFEEIKQQQTSAKVEIEDAISKLTREIEMLKAVIVQLESQGGQNVAEYRVQFQKLQNQLKLLQKESTELNKENKELQEKATKSEGELKDQQEKIKAFELQINTLKKEQTEGINNLQKQQTEGKNNLLNLNDKLTLMSTTNENLENEKNALELNIKQLKKDLRIEEYENASLNQKIKELDKNYKNIKFDFEFLQRRYIEMLDKYNEKDKELKRIMQNIEESEKKSQDLTNLETDFTNIKEYIKTTKSDKSQQDTIIKMLDDIQTKIGTVKTGGTISNEAISNLLNAQKNLIGTNKNVNKNLEDTTAS